MLFAAAVIMLLVVVLRERLLIRLDTWVHPETADQRRALATATAALAQASQARTIGRTVSRTVNHGCGSPATLLVASDSGTASQDYAAPDATLAPLSRASAIVHMLERAGGSLRVHPNDATSGPSRHRCAGGASTPWLACASTGEAARPNGFFRNCCSAVPVPLPLHDTTYIVQHVLHSPQSSVQRVRCRRSGPIRVLHALIHLFQFVMDTLQPLA